MKRIVIYTLILITTFFSACSLMNEEQDQRVVARVGDSYLYENDLSHILDPNTKRGDSVMKVTKFIEDWATKQLLKNKAEINLSQDLQTEYNKLADDYKYELLSSAYLNGLIAKKVDTIVDANTIKQLYQETKSNFILSEPLLQFRFIAMTSDNSDIKELRKRFKRFDIKDQRYLDSLSIHFNDYSFNDSLWVKQHDFLKRLPIFDSKQQTNLLNKTYFYELKDSLKLYLIKIEAYKDLHSLAPKQYVEGTLKQIILNKRKLKLISKIKTELKKDAKKNKEFEIYK